MASVFGAAPLKPGVLSRCDAMDIFGNTHPKKMPRHFFFSALAVHHETAVRAGAEFSHTFQPRSLTVLRIPVK